MASLKKISKTKRGMRNTKILTKRHAKARKYAQEQQDQKELINSLLKTSA